MNKELWHADINIANDFARNIIEQQFPELSPVTLKYLGEGWDNKVFLVNHQLVFRFPQRKTAAILIARETAVLRNLQHLSPLQVPNPVYLGTPDKDYPYDFHGYPMITGKSGHEADLSLAARSASITELAKFLKTLHSIAEPQARLMGAKEQVFDRTETQRLINDLTERVEKITDRHIVTINQTLFNDEMRLAAAVNLPKTNVLVHGDLHCRHLMFDKEKLVGIIDWGDVGINSPVIDLGAIFSFYPSDCHHAFFDIYGEIAEETLTYARFLGLYSSLTLLLYGHDMDDAALVRETEASIHRINPELIYRS